MAPNSGLELFVAHDDPSSTCAVAHTISLSFAQDPLIRWIRPNAPLWAIDQPDTNRWQYRRVQRAILEGTVLRSASATQLAQQHPPKRQQANPSHFVGKGTGKDAIADAGIVALIFPPKQQQKWTLSRVLLALKLWVLDLIHPGTDKGADEKRVDMLLDAHDTAIDNIKSRYGIDDPWYLEVVAVHPSLQGRGLGRIAMSWILDYVGHHPFVLECTAKQNVGFYESLGFEVVEELELVDGDTVNCWVMLRQDVQKKDGTYL